MDFKTAINTCLKLKYTNFSDRASRSEYWWFILFNAVVSFIGNIVGTVLALIASSMTSSATVIIGVAYIPILIVLLILIVPGIAVTIRRVHDLDLSGWWVLGMYIAACIPLVNIVALIVAIIFLCKPGTVGTNRFGPNPIGDNNYQQTFQ